MLPTKKTTPVFEMENYKWLVYGQPKIGKTTFASQFKDALFLATEEGHKCLEVFKVDILSWLDFAQTYNDLKTAKEKGELKFKTIVIDTIDNLYDFCMEYVCETNGMTHPSDEAYGKGWKLVQTEWTKRINAITRLGIGVVFISHAKDIPFKFRNMELTKTTYTLSGQAGEFIAGLSDIVAYIGFNPKNLQERICIVRGSETLVAGDRTGKLGEMLPFSFDEIKTQLIKGDK